MQELKPIRDLTSEEQKAFGKLLFEDIFPLVKKYFDTAGTVNCDEAAFHAYAYSYGESESADVSVCPSGLYTAVYESRRDTWGGLDTWSGIEKTTKKAEVYSLSDEAAYSSGDWVPGWDQYDGAFSGAVKKIGESAAEARQALQGNTFLILFRDPLGLKGWFGISFEEQKVEAQDGYIIRDEYKKWALKKPVGGKAVGEFRAEV